jgi:two-component system chemotaxis response regulator CheY
LPRYFSLIDALLAFFAFGGATSNHTVTIANPACLARFQGNTMRFEECTVLVVDDNDGTRRLAVQLLRALGVRDAIGTTCIQEAQVRLQQESIGAILTDWEMIEETGLDLVQAVRSAEDEEIRRLPIIMMTAYGEEWRVKAAKDAGVSEFILKPLSPAQIARKLRAALRDGRPIPTANTEGGTERRAAARDSDGETTPRQLSDADSTMRRLRGDFETFLADAAAQITLDVRNAKVRPELAGEIGQRIFRLAHNIKGQGSSFNYPLATNVASALCNFLRNRQDLNERDLLLIAGYSLALEAIALNRVMGTGGELGNRILERLRGFVTA